MKKIYLFTLFIFLGSVAFAQLGAPNITKKDTLQIAVVSYNGTELDSVDWPATYLVEDAVNLYVANYKYVKNKATHTEASEFDLSWKGFIDVVVYGNAKCNGVKQSIVKVTPHKDCELNDVIKYVIGDYEFYVWNKNALHD